MSLAIRKQTIDTKGLFKCRCFNNKKQGKSYVWVYLAIWLVVTFILNICLLDAPYFFMQSLTDNDSRDQGDQGERWDIVASLVTAACVTDLLVLVFYLILLIGNPGDLKRKDELEFPTWSELMENVSFKMLCPECKIIREPRSRHCYDCNKCISRFDHHCPWVNNCIGGQNNRTFLFFLISIVVLILLIFAVEIFVIFMTYQCLTTDNWCL